MKKILIFSSTRADYGILEDLTKSLIKKNFFKTFLFITGNHFSSHFGKTIKEINLPKNNVILGKIKISTNSKKSILKNAFNFFKIYINLFKNNHPDYVIVLGDRYETLIFCQLMYFLNIPIIHFCGGDVTLGSQDNTYRNMISFLSNFHFVTNQKSKNQLIKILGEKKNIYNFGHLALNNIKKIKLKNKNYLRNKYSVKFEKQTILVSYHSDITENKNLKNFKYLVNSLNNLENVFIIFTSSNIDFMGSEINNEIKKFCKKNKHKSIFIKSFGKIDYFSMLNNVDFLLGNSSSGFYEAPSFGTSVINIGTRQNGRLKSHNITNIAHFDKLFETKLKRILKKTRKSKKYVNPYYKTNTLKNVIKTIKKIVIN